MKNKKATSIDWLESMVYGMIQNGGDADLLGVIEHIQKAREMDKEQKMDAFNEARLTNPMIGFKYLTFQDYYIETYGI